MRDDAETLTPSSAPASSPVVAGAVITHVLVEGSPTPIGIDVPPRISWMIGADAADVEVLDTEVAVLCDSVAVWTGHPGRLGNEVECPLSRLASDTRYDVVVRVRTTSGSASAATWFRTGLLDAADWRESRWIGAPTSVQGAAPVFRAEFVVPEGATSARMVLAAGGLAHVLVNGRPAGAEVLSVGLTGFDRRVQYAMWDIGGDVAPGPNVVTVELGRGLYAMSEPNVWNWETAPWHAEPCVRFLVLVDRAGHRSEAVLASLPGLAVSAGGTVYDDLYGGESHDARLVPTHAHGRGQGASAWAGAVSVAGPAGVLVHRRQQPIRVMETVVPRVVGHEGDHWLLDVGRVIAGWARLRVRGPRGHRIQLVFGERLTADGRVDNRDVKGHYAGRFQVDEYTLRGADAPEEWEPQFTWHGFRYIEVRGWPGDAIRPGAVLAQVVHNDVAPAGDFQASDRTLTEIHRLVTPTLLNNLHSIPTDTPMFEKNGWTADGMLGTHIFLQNLDTHELLAKWVDDIADTCDSRGIPQVLAPFGGWDFAWSPAPPWHAAYVLIPWWLYQHSADRRVLDRHADGILRYLAAERDRSPGGLATTTLGDWDSPETPPDGGNPPEDARVPATAFLAHMLDTGSRICSTLGRHEDATRLRREFDLVRRAFQAEFLDTDAGILRGSGEDTYRQSHNVLGLAFGLVPDRLTEAVARHLVDDIRSRGMHLNTGALSTRHLLPVLTAFGHADVALALARQRTFPSWGYWLDLGASTLWEHWRPDSRSLDHYFFGTIDEWFVGSVAGLERGDVGWSTVRFQPRLTALLDSASAWTTTRYGRASIEWQVSDGQLEVVAEVPVGARGDVRLPPGIIATGGTGRPRDGARVCGSETVIMTGSGRHRFTVPLIDAAKEATRGQGHPAGRR